MYDEGESTIRRIRDAVLRGTARGQSEPEVFATIRQILAPVAPLWTPRQLAAYGALSSNNQHALSRSCKAACYFCEARFKAATVRTDRRDVTCPHCGIDAVIGDAVSMESPDGLVSGCGKALIAEMRRFWFGAAEASEVAAWSDEKRAAPGVGDGSKSRFKIHKAAVRQCRNCSWRGRPSIKHERDRCPHCEAPTDVLRRPAPVKWTEPKMPTTQTVVMVTAADFADPSATVFTGETCSHSVETAERWIPCGAAAVMKVEDVSPTRMTPAGQIVVAAGSAYLCRVHADEVMGITHRQHCGE